MSNDLGFSFRKAGRGEVKISHNGRHATTLRGNKADAFLQDMQVSDHRAQQQEMARVTGNYKRGNERQARNHPRNQ
ncbi:MAG: hypothetical protein JXQ85_15760 [Cognatishimia sp.]|uniref:hypothetical protein n=1 Tax=Cognatishimia sp. TaxID=2211648 RepID=UPI003B8ADD2A